MAFDLKDITGIGSVAEFGKQVVSAVERFLPAKKMTEAERAQAEMAVQQLTGQRDSELLDTQKSIIVAEMQQGDDFTKRARPSVVYVGLGIIVLNNAIFPIMAWIFACVASIFDFMLPELPELSLPPAFWATWGGMCSIWIVGRSAEKRGALNKVVNMITGAMPMGR